MAVNGYPLAAAVLQPFDAMLASDIAALYDSQVLAFDTEGWGGQWFRRGFADNGNPLAPDYLFLEPQVLPSLAGIVTDERREDLGGVDQPQVEGIWPVANAWLTELYAMSDPEAGWSSFIRNSLTAHAEAYPDIWYGIWTGPDSYNGPTHERAGEADAHIVTALTDYPALNAHIHTSPLRALMGIVGVSGTAKGIRIDPRLPTESFSVVWPRLSVRSLPNSIRGTITASASEQIELGVTVPSGLRQGELVVTAGGEASSYRREGNVVWIELQVQRDAPVSWAITPP